MPAMISRGCAQPGSGKADTDACPSSTSLERRPTLLNRIFAIVADVGSYKEFLPLVTQSRVMHRKTLPDGRESFDATTTIVHDKLRIRRNHAQPCHRGPGKQHRDGAFGRWAGEIPGYALGDPAAPNGGSEIEFSVDYALKSRSLQFLLSGMFDLVVRKIMNAFEARADELYGSRSASS